jgi:hypothetical protein
MEGQVADCLGDLVDRLSIVNIKLFMVQERVHSAARDGVGIDADTVQKLSALNLERNRLMTAIDKAGGGRVDAHVKLA